MISIITVNYKTANYLEKMFESLFAFHKNNIEIIVVENKSGDDLSSIRSRFPQVKLIYSDKNLGFAGGCNLGIKHATGEYIVLINPDIVFISDAIYQIKEAMQNNPDVGIGGISLKNFDKTQQNCVWRFPKPVDQLLLLLKVHHLFPKVSAIAKWRMDDFDYSQDADVDQVMGAFFCIRKKTLDDIGLLDDKFFIWYEEVDYCRRAKTAGWRVRYFANISAMHKKGSSFDRIATIEKQRVLRKSIRRYMRKHTGLLIGLIFYVLEPIFIITSRIAAFIKPI